MNEIAKAIAGIWYDTCDEDFARVSAAIQNIEFSVVEFEFGLLYEENWLTAQSEGGALFLRTRLISRLAKVKTS